MSAFLYFATAGDILWQSFAVPIIWHLRHVISIWTRLKCLSNFEIGCICLASWLLHLINFQTPSFLVQREKCKLCLKSGGGMEEQAGHSSGCCWGFLLNSLSLISVFISNEKLFLKEENIWKVTKNGEISNWRVASNVCALPLEAKENRLICHKLITLQRSDDGLKEETASFELGAALAWVLWVGMVQSACALTKAETCCNAYQQKCLCKFSFSPDELM